MDNIGPTARGRAKVDRLNTHTADYDYTSAPRRVRFTRRSLRQMRRYVVYTLTALVVLFLWNTFDPPAEESRLARYTLRRLKRGKEGEKRKGSIGRDGRLHLNWPGWDGIRNIYAFGDSHSETGFDPTGTQPSTSNPLGNPSFPGNTAPYGPNYLTHLTATHNSSLIFTHNLARGGLPHQTHRPLDDGTGTSMSLHDQIIEVFLPTYGRSSGRSRIPGGSGWMQDDTLFVVYAMVDEFVSDYMLRGADGQRNVTNEELKLFEYENNLGRLYDYGARNFHVLGLPALEESPQIRNCGRNDSLKVFGAETVSINGRLAFSVQSFALTHPDATVFFFNNLKYSVSTRNDPTTYPETAHLTRMEGYCYFYADRAQEVVNDDEACGAGLRDFYWRDEVHHTGGYHRLMSRLMVEEMADLRNALPLEFV